MIDNLKKDFLRRREVKMTQVNKEVDSDNRILKFLLERYDCITIGAVMRSRKRLAGIRQVCQHW